MRSKIDEAVSVLHRDGLIVYPTETVYGLGCDAFSENAIHRVYEVKKRPVSNPISVAVCDLEMALAITLMSDFEQEFIERFLPGPVTAVVKAGSCIPKVLTGGTDYIGIRIPDNETALNIIREFDAPITSTSANISGGKSPVDFNEVTVVYDLFVDGGRLPGTPSTVVDLCRKEVIRAGPQLDEIGRYLADEKE
ncbi:L-threonylcarbamoyladenylate synthase [Methanomicrobium sp. W14]|uniref:L-threonylcarbamoyladenylate synthase n=1 Tax=Methanomicrobium sp. W14 TaxID=2817839 RepID=UPI001AE4662D|nr:L-threonylcarbamoyladenylate synthase [Methanomicrobium sp. W14]MBP2132960.1 L-threonylcarbamoyladenylate synthase [Methanomicrobium sp. W14]